MVTPICFAACTTIWAYCGISTNCSVISCVVNPDACPAADSSDFALAMFCARWATVVLVDGKTGANGLSLPMAALPLNSACTMAGRSSVSAIAWRTRGSVNGAWSLRIDSCRCALDLRLMMLYGAPGASNCSPPATANCPTTSMVPPVRARIRGVWVS